MTVCINNCTILSNSPMLPCSHIAQSSIDWIIAGLTSYCNKYIRLNFGKSTTGNKHISLQTILTRIIGEMVYIDYCIVILTETVKCCLLSVCKRTMLTHYYKYLLVSKI